MNKVFVRGCRVC